MRAKCVLYLLCGEYGFWCPADEIREMVIFWEEGLGHTRRESLYRVP